MLPVGFAITELVVRLGLLQALEHFLGVVWLSLKKDSNLRRQSRQIYSLIPLAAREPLHGVLLSTCRT